MNKIFAFITTSLLLTASSSALSMHIQPRKPKRKKQTRITILPQKKIIQFAAHINTGDFVQAIDDLNGKPPHHITEDARDLLQQTMTEDNMFYSNKNFKNTDLGPINRRHLKAFALGIMRNGQKPQHSYKTNEYYTIAKIRFTQG